MKTFQDQLAEAREKSGMTQEDAAKLLDVSQRTISNWEKGIGKPSKFAQKSMLEIIRNHQP